MLALDTNTLIYFFKGMGKVAERLLATPPSEIAVPTVCVYEIEFGIARSDSPARRRQQFDELLDVVTVLPFDQPAAAKAAELRATLEGAGQPIGPLDTLIAGTVLAHNATLVTHNVSEFSRVPELTVVDWFE